MAGDPQVLSALAEALAYPGQATPALVAHCANARQWAPPDAAEALSAYAAELTGQSVEAMQELFTGAFDFDPKCTLDLGWHLFGENYDRGDFLVRLRVLLAEHGIDEGTELPDHLPKVLHLLGRLPAGAAAALAAESVVPAVDKILDGMGERQGPYPPLMRGVRAAVSALTHSAVDEAPHV